jgi:hypothetical protein
MVTKATLAMLEMTIIEDYFEYIIDSRTNGQHEQSKALFSELSDKQQSAFFDWVEQTYYYDADDMSEYITEMQNIKKYFE